MSAAAEKLAADRHALNLVTCPKCFNYSTGDDDRCPDCGCRLYPTLPSQVIDRGGRPVSPEASRPPQEGTA